MDTVESVKAYIEANKGKNPFDQSPLKSVQQLSGGYVNFVYRLEFENSTTSILKNYPSYFSFDKSKSLKLSTGRYFAEKVKIYVLYNIHMIFAKNL
jgi:hypothetical protein